MNSNDSRLLSMLCACLLVLMAASVFPNKLAAQENENGAQEPEQANGPSQEDQGPITETERINRLRKTIALDREKLIQTRKEFAELETFFKTLNGYIQKAESDLAEKVTRFEALGSEGASEETAALQTEIQALKERITLAKAELELRFHSGKTVQSQIQALEQKITNDEQALEKLPNPTLVLPETPPARPATAPPRPLLHQRPPQPPR